MSSKSLPIAVWLILTGLVTQTAAAQDLRTLFTTPAERQLINSNRHNSDEVTEVVAVEETRVEVPSLKHLIHKEFTREYQVSGITVSQEGTYTVWINAQSYEDGGVLDDGSKVEVVTNGNLRVRITTPDGKRHHALSGETLEVKFLAAVDERDVDPDDLSAYADPLGGNQEARDGTKF